MKTCTGECGLRLPLEEFGRGGKGPDGRHPRCRKCLAAAARRRRAAKPDFQARAKQRQERADLAAQGMKRCARPMCLRVLSVEDFFVSSKTADGRYPYCRDCCQVIDAARRPKIGKPEPVNTYTGVHSRLPSLESRTCFQCNGGADEWAYDHTDPDELISDRGCPYSLDPARYRPMCRSCHRKYDADHRKVTGTAAPRKRRLKPCAVCQQGFWNPSHHRKTCSPTCETALRSRSQYERKVRLSGRIARELAAISRIGAAA